MSNNVVGRFVGGSPAMVALRLIVISFIVGVILETFGLSAFSLFSNAVRAARRLFELGFTDVRQLGRMLLTGGMVVVPVWLALRLLDSGGRR
jgi:hypothetical protein